MRKLSCGRALDLLCMFPGVAYSTCLCVSNNNVSDEENKPLIHTNTPQKAAAAVKLEDVIASPPTLAFQLKPKMVVLRVSMHCHGCARKVEKHISKLEGVTSYQVDLATKMVVVRGDIVPFEVLASVSKVKYAELWEQ